MIAIRPAGTAALRAAVRAHVSAKSVGRGLMGASLCAALSLGLSGHAQAQDATPPGAMLEEITVTGSRIMRRDYEANSPLISVESELLESRTGLNIESYLNQLPNYNPAASPVTTQQDVQITPVNSVGISSISLRGFGPNRNLVLVDGQRMVPINALMVTDVSSIPSALIERVEIISGGASAVYGADAIGGVTNFILKKNFEGVELDTQASSTEAGDGEEYRTYALMGTNFDGGRGNVTFGVEYYKREAAYEKNRDFYKRAWADPTVGGDFFVFGYNGYNTAFSFNNPSAATAEAIMGNPVRAFGSPGSFEGYRFNNDGSLFVTGSGNNIGKYLAGGGVIDNYNYAVQHAYDGTIEQRGQLIDTLKWNYTEAYASSPQERYSLFASGRYDLTDNIEFYARGTWAESKTRTRLFPANASFGWEASIPYNPVTDSPVDPTLDWTDPNRVRAALADETAWQAYANPNFIGTGQPGAQHPVPVEFAILLNSRPNPAGDWILETYPSNSFDARSTLNTNTVWQVDAGVRFDLPFGDWTGDVYLAHGESSTYNVAYGNNSLTRWRLLVSQPDYGRNATLEANQPNTSPPGSPPASPGFGGAVINCTSGFYDMIFHGDTRPSEDCRTAVQANLQTRTQMQQDVIEASFQGGLFDLPAGEVRAAVGAQYRKNSAQFFPDILQSTSSFADQVVGVYPTGYLDAEMNVKDYFAELLVPVVSDLPFMQRFELELGGRHSDYSVTESTTTYKALGNWQVNNFVRLRGGYNRATRAPNLGELFLNVQEIFTIGGNFSDPCGARSNAPWGAGGVAPDPTITPGEGDPQLAAGQTQAGAESAYLICQAMMGEAGAQSFYGTDQVQPGAGGGFAWVLQQGNPDLVSEKADTWTVGMVFSSPWSNPWLAGLTATIDWWKVDIKDAIQQYSIDYANYLCYGAVTVTNAAEAAAQAATRACRNVERSTTSGNPLTALIEYDNQATIATKGIDVSVNWFAPFADIGLASLPGGLGVNLHAGWLDYYKTKQSPLPFDVETDWVGTLGPNLTGTNPGAYEYRINLGLNWITDNKGISLRWRHLPSVWDAGRASQEAIIRNNERVAAGGEGILLSYTPSTSLKTGSYNIFDLSFNWDLSPTVSLRGGIDNLFDTQPKITGGAGDPGSVTGARAGYAYDPNKSEAENLAMLSSVCGDAPGCVNPTAFMLPSTGAGFTNAGYYDTLGRRYYLGLKVQF